MAQVQCPTCHATTATDTGFCQYCNSPLQSGAAPPPGFPQPVVGAPPAMNYATAVPPPGAPPPQQWPHPPAQGWPQGVPPPPPAGQPAWPAPPPQGAPPPWPQAQQPGQMAAPPPGYPQPPPPGYGQPPPPYGYPQPGAPMPPPGMMPPPGTPGVAFYPPAGPPTPKQLGSDALALRIVAIFIDGIIVGIVAYFLSFFWGPLGFIGGLISWWFPSILLAVYMMVMEGTRGQTIGKMLLNLKVVREDMGPVTMKEAQGRAMGVLLWPLLIFILLDLIWVADEGQRLGDKWAHTTVIKVA